MNALEFKLNDELISEILKLPKDVFNHLLTFYPRPVHPNCSKFKFLSHWFFYNIPRHVAVKFILSENWQKVFHRKFTGCVEEFLSTFSHFREEHDEKYLD